MTAKTNLAEEKKQLTRERILRGLAEEVLENGAHELSIQGVADRAGVSHRTVYRYFPTKDELFQAYAHWLDELLRSDSNMPQALDEVAERAAETFRRFDQESLATQAYVRIYSTGTTLEARKERSRHFARMVEDALPELDDEYRRAAACVIRQIVNSETWARARQEFGIEGEPMGEVAEWALRLLIDAMAAGDVPAHWTQDD